ncbi:uncharacterized protein LOC108102460 isoform X2 [Drosophila eugracilis]|uniref:uncharacterized protein LOC108102460 isoform X2 n=1 Tax=Drosophila eugracilis TaxID=29029 RepID=UPI0007E75E71|nr:uncharacterized protein LOC108102460 isoform X2 [Drosophila eugracilis]
MDNLDTTFDKPEFDWDAINVGDYQLDHSQNFFAANKENNNRFSNVNFLLSCPTPQKISRGQNDQLQEIKLNTGEPKQEPTKDPKAELQEPKPDHIHENNNRSSNANDILSCPTPQKIDLEQNEGKINCNTGKIKEEYVIRSNDDLQAPKSAHVQKPTSYTQQIVPLNSDNDVEKDGKHITEDKQHMTEADQHLAHQDRVPSPVSGAGGKLRLQWSPPRHREHEGTAAAAAPKAYQFKDVYESKRLQMMRKLSEEENKARQFHSRPMPNFRAMHKRMGELVVTHKITIPRTPETLKHCQTNNMERRRQDQERPAASRSKPFHLRSEQRVRDRREFDAAVQVSLDQKKKEQDEQRKRCEQEEIKEIRKMTVFKARPNPFK